MKVRTAKKTNRTKGDSESGKLSLNLTKPVVKFAVAKADTSYDGNISMYVRSLIKRDMGKEQAA